VLYSKLGLDQFFELAHENYAIYICSDIHTWTHDRLSSLLSVFEYFAVKLKLVLLG